MMAGFASVSLLLGVVGAVSFYYARQANDAYIDLLQYYAVRANVKDIAKNILRQSNSLRDYLLDPGDDSFEDLQQDNSNLSALIDKTIAMDNMQDEQGFLQKLKELNQELMKKSDWVVSLAKTNRAQAVEYSKDEVFPLVRQMQSDESNVEDPKQNKNAAIEKRQSTAYIVVINARLITILCSIGFVLSILVGITYSLFISRPFVRIIKMAKQITFGDLTGNGITTNRQDEMGILTKSSRSDNLPIEIKGNSHEVVMINKAFDRIFAQLNTLSGKVVDLRLQEMNARNSHAFQENAVGDSHIGQAN